MKNFTPELIAKAKAAKSAERRGASCTCQGKQRGTD